MDLEILLISGVASVAMTVVIFAFINRYVNPRN